MSAGTDFVAMLMEMGFSKEKAEKGLSMTGNVGVEAAMEWIFNHADEFEPGSSKSTSEPPAASTSDSAPPPTDKDADAEAEVAKSIKCEDCNKLFKTQLEVEYHATKSGHSNFSESTEEKKPLTEEERREQLRKIEEKLKLKRKEREEKEKQEALDKEKRRIQTGKEMTEAKKKMEEQEMKKIVEQRKREKEEERQARLRVKQLIEADKLARKGITPDNVASTVVAAPEVKAPVVSAPPKDYSQTRIQIRLTNGSTLTETFNVKEQLAAVRLYVEMNRTDEKGPFSLMTNFPKKIFTEDEYGQRLEDLKLVPSAVLIVTKSKA